MSEPTAIFSIHDEKDEQIREILQQVYAALKEKGYNPVNQLVGYILSEDPTYITTHNGAAGFFCARGCPGFRAAAPG